VRSRGFEVRTGDCLFGDGLTVAPPAARAAELTSMLLDPDVHAVVPPWGGELLIELLPHLDFDALAQATPTWFAGWSDATTFMLPLLLRSGWMSLHGLNLMDASFAPAPGVAPWWEVLQLPAGASFTQHSVGRLQRAFRDYRHEPHLDAWLLQERTRWRRLGPDEPVAFEGRLVGGCADVVSRLVGTPYGEVARWSAQHGPTIVFLENCGMPAPDAARCWHQLVLAGWFDHAAGVLVGRTTAPSHDDYTQQQALADALGGVVDRGVPVLFDVDIGHQPPQLMLVHGASAQVRYEGGAGRIEQRLG
jgi:muramoyltetrapeptide carboxypeptidase LdcA involved in peptidoglycan recycling